MYYGYVYKTTNKINNKIYIGKHEKSSYDPSYFGSGKILEQAIKKYGKENFLNEVIAFYDTKDELDAAEKYYINHYNNIYETYNIASGGDGGNVFKYATSSDIIKFKEKMTKINSERCKSENFKKQVSERMHNKYLDKNERFIQSIKVKKAWSNKTLREEQSSRLKEYYSAHVRDCSFNNKKMKLIISNNVLIFNSRKELLGYLKNEYDFSIGSRSLNRIIEQSLNNNGYNPYHKNKFKNLIGMKIYYIEDVETNGDECNHVGVR